MKLGLPKLKFLSWVKTHKVPAALLSLLLIIGGIFGYNKYLDWRNVQDMKQLLSAFEQLETDVEADTGEELTIEAACSSVGKFATSYACNLTLLQERGYFTYDRASLLMNNIKVPNKDRCEILAGGKDLFQNALNCNIKVRLQNKDRAESIFYEYDTTPGRAF